MQLELVSTPTAAYRVPFRVLVASMCRHLRPDTRVRWHVFAPDLGAGERVALEEGVASHPVRFVWYDGRVDTGVRLPLRGRAVEHIYARLFLAERLPEEVERYLYLDVDTLVLSDLVPLWNTDLRGAVLAAVQDLAVPLVSSPLGLTRFEALGFASRDAYFNAGVLLVDRRSWQSRDIGRRAVAFLRERGDAIHLLDQEALNVATSGRWRPLHYRWNLIASIAGRSFHRLDGVDEALLADAVERPGIVHFAGTFKPWRLRRSGSRWSRTYRSALARACPHHAFDGGPHGRLLSLYDRRLRRFLYPLERTLWSMKGGF